MLFFLQYRNTKFKLTGGDIKHKRNNTQMQASDQCTCATNTHTPRTYDDEERDHY